MTSSFEESIRNNANLPPALPRFAHINRYWDPHKECFTAKILPGQFYVTLQGEMIVTVLGSCVSACVRDSVAGIAGMNHFMLPGMRKGAGAGKVRRDAYEAEIYGINAMESLINEILKNGGRRENLEVKITGGGRILDNLSDVGTSNINFIRSFLKTDGLRLAGEDVGGIYPRKVYYSAATGIVNVKKLIKLKNNTIFNREHDYEIEIESKLRQGNLVIFDK